MDWSIKFNIDNFLVEFPPSYGAYIKLLYLADLEFKENSIVLKILKLITKTKLPVRSAIIPPE